MGRKTCSNRRQEVLTFFELTGLPTKKLEPPAVGCYEFSCGEGVGTSQQIGRGVDEAEGDGFDDTVGDAHFRIRGLGQHVALVVDVIDPDEFAGAGEGDFAGEEVHAGESRDFAHALPERFQSEAFDFVRCDFGVAVGERIPPTPPERTEGIKETPVSWAAFKRVRDYLFLEKIFFVGPCAHRQMEIFFVVRFKDDAAFAVAARGFHNEWVTQKRLLLGTELKKMRLDCFNNDRRRDVDAGGFEARMEETFVEGGAGDRRRIDDDGFAAFGKIDDFVKGIFGEMMLAMHVQQRARPDIIAFEGFEKSADPEWFDEEEIEAFFGAAALDAMDEKSVGIQLMRHD